MVSCTFNPSDTLLVPFLEAPDGAESAQQLDRLFHQQATPLIASIVRRKWPVCFSPGNIRGETLDQQDADDVRGEATTQLLARLHQCKARPHEKPIRDFRAYVSVTAFHACDHALREKYPQRHGLKGQLNHLLTHNAKFAQWKNAQGSWLCGFAGWHSQQTDFPDTGRLALLRQSPNDFVRAAGIDINSSQPDLAPLLEAVFTWVGHPFGLNDLIKALVEVYNLQPRVAQTGNGGEEDVLNPLEQVADPFADVAALVERRALLQTLWGEICQLPSRQRAALLLNLRDAQNGGVLDLLPLTGIATRREIAQALGMCVKQLDALWDRLPWDDLAIAHHLGITRQQVIDARKIARKRLVRRMRLFEAK